MIVLRSDVVSVMSAGNKKRFFPQEILFVFGVRAATGAASAEAAESAGDCRRCGISGRREKGKRKLAVFSGRGAV